MLYYIVKKVVPLRDFPSSKVGNVVKKLSIGTLVTVDDCGKFTNTELGKTYLPVIMDGSRLWAHETYLQAISDRQAAAIKHGESWLGRKPQTKAIAWYNSTAEGKKSPKKKEAYCTVGALWGVSQGIDLGDLISKNAPTLETKARKKGIFHAKDSGYTPKCGDLLLCKGSGKTSASHTELIVIKVGETLHTINYNSSGICKRQERKVSDSYVYGYVEMKF
jgi:hypothetical protein